MTKWTNFFCITLASLFLLPTLAHARGEGEVVVSALIVLVIIAVVFLILREVMCWYWKINIRVELLTEIRNLLKNNSQISMSGEVMKESTPIKPGTPTSQCTICKKQFPSADLEIFKGKTVCPECYKSKS